MFCCRFAGLEDSPHEVTSSKKITRGHAIFMDFLGSVMIIRVMDKAKDCIE